MGVRRQNPGTHFGMPLFRATYATRGADSALSVSCRWVHTIGCPMDLREINRKKLNRFIKLEEYKRLWGLGMPALKQLSLSYAIATMPSLCEHIEHFQNKTS